MIKIFNVVMGDVVSSPFAPRSKMISAALLPAALSAGSNVFSSVLGAYTQSQANKQNIQLARETNAQNYKMFKEQQAYNLDMWNKQNEYNLPVNQVQRLLAAGINPSAVFGNGSVTPASQVGGVNQPNLVTPHVNPYQPNLNVGEAVNAFNESMLVNAQRKKLEADTKHTEQLNMFDMRAMDSRIKSLEAMAKRDDALGEMARSELRFTQDSYWYRLKQLRQDITRADDEHTLTTERIYQQRLQNGLSEVQLAYAPRLNQAQLNQYYATVNQIKAQIGLINANKLLTDEQRLHEIEKKTSTIIDNGLKAFDYNVKSAVKDFIIQDYQNNSEMLDFERRNQKSGERLRRFTSVIPFAAGYNSAASKRMFSVP